MSVHKKNLFYAHTHTDALHSQIWSPPPHPQINPFPSAKKIYSTCSTFLGLPRSDNSGGVDSYLQKLQMLRERGGLNSNTESQRPTTQDILPPPSTEQRLPPIHVSSYWYSL